MKIKKFFLFSENDSSVYGRWVSGRLRRSEQSGNERLGRLVHVGSHSVGNLPIRVRTPQYLCCLRTITGTGLFLQLDKNNICNWSLQSGGLLAQKVRK